jgi:hypothetical protein
MTARSLALFALFMRSMTSPECLPMGALDLDQPVPEIGHPAHLRLAILVPSRRWTQCIAAHDNGAQE